MPTIGAAATADLDPATVIDSLTDPSVRNIFPALCASPAATAILVCVRVLKPGTLSTTL